MRSKNVLSIRIPGKTFLIGEYLALHGGPALLASTRPEFCLKVDRSRVGDLIFHPESPAGRYYHTQRDLLNSVSLQWQDPFLGRGGMGASSAQFLALYLYVHHLQSEQFNTDNIVDPWSMLKTYQEMAQPDFQVKPSGYDVLSQLAGEISYVYAQQKKITQHVWPFRDVGFWVISTGLKIATHGHLHELPPMSTCNMHSILEGAMVAFQQGDSVGFGEALEDFSDLLHEQGLVVDNTQNLLRDLRAQSFVLAAKGCGALCADTILVLFPRAEEAALIEYCRERNLMLVAQDMDLTLGAKVEIQPLREVSNQGDALA